MKTRSQIIIVAFLLFCAVKCCAQVIPQSALDTMRVFRSIQSAMLHPDQVFRLDISKQKLHSFPMEIFQMKNLNELILDKNRLQHIPEEISQLSYLQILACEHNEIEIIPAGLLKLSNLKKLNLADNLISTLPDHIDDLQKLEILSLWDNPIEIYPESIAELTQLKFLDLLHNQINYNTQDRLRSMLPNTKIIMSPPCNCKDGEE